MDRWTRMLDDLGRQRAELTRVNAELARLTATATSADRLISVTVNARGLLIDLTVIPAALRRYRADTLSETITALVGEADMRLRERRDRLLTDIAQLTPQIADARPGTEKVHGDA